MTDIEVKLMTAFVSSLPKGIILVFMYVVFHIDAM